MLCSLPPYPHAFARTYELSVYMPFGAQVLQAVKQLRARNARDKYADTPLDFLGFKRLADFVDRINDGCNDFVMEFIGTVKILSDTLNTRLDASEVRKSHNPPMLLYFPVY
jgi:hypothetical protein